MRLYILLTAAVAVTSLGTNPCEHEASHARAHSAGLESARAESVRAESVRDGLPAAGTGTDSLVRPAIRPERRYAQIVTVAVERAPEPGLEPIGHVDRVDLWRIGPRMRCDGTDDH